MAEMEIGTRVIP